MWNRSMFKENAKIPLRQTYWTALLVTFIAGILMSVGSGNGAAQGAEYYMDGNMGYFPAVAFLTLGAAGLGFGLLFGLFVSNPIEVGRNRFFLENRNAPASIQTLFSAFRGNYMKVVFAMGMRTLFVWLWSLLLIIPGVIAYYAYFAVPYLMAENPHLEWRAALDISKRMTQGYKMELFVLNLSFLGWYLLGAMACFVGMFFVEPYYYGTHTEAYAFLRQQAIDNGAVHPQEIYGNPNNYNIGQ